jgi:crotonobetaine/carnitine-CoA ligase
VGIPSEFGDEEVLLAIVLASDGELDPRGLIDYLNPIVPAFALPSAIRVLPDLPRTQATQRVQKHRLRAEGLTPDAWRRPSQRLSTAPRADSRTADAAGDS